MPQTAIPAATPASPAPRVTRANSRDEDLKLLRQIMSRVERLSPSSRRWLRDELLAEGVGDPYDGLPGPPA